MDQSRAGLGSIGIWWSGTWAGADGSAGGGAKEAEALGYGTLWSSGGFEPGLAPRFGRLLDATGHVPVASGIASIWHATPGELADGAEALDHEHPGRFLLGLGVSHQPVVDRLGVDYERPFSKMVAHLDALDDLGPAVGRERRILAALGPRMLTLAAERALGAHPYFVPVEHVERARRLMGSGPILAPELAVVLEEDHDRARATARTYTAGYLALPNYATNLRTLGFADEDLQGAGSNRLIDAVVACGGPAAVADRIRSFLDAGADHVCIQVISERAGTFPLDAYRQLASALDLG